MVRIMDKKYTKEDVKKMIAKAISQSRKHETIGSGIIAATVLADHGNEKKLAEDKILTGVYVKSVTLGENHSIVIETTKDKPDLIERRDVIKTLAYIVDGEAIWSYSRYIGQELGITRKELEDALVNKDD